MSNWFKIIMAKNAFKASRGDIYELLEHNFTESGSRKVSTIREIFLSWANREASRKNNIYLAHKAIANRLENGMSFSKAIEPFIPREESLILEAGEASGKLATALRSVQLQNKASREINALVAAAMTEPAMSALSIMGTGWFCGASLWPEMLKVVKEEYWPGWALPLVNFEIGLAQNWQFLPCVLLLAWLYLWSIPRWTGPVRLLFDKVPPWSIYRDRQGAAFLGVLGGLLNSGMELDAALARIEHKSDRWLSWHIAKIRRRLAVAGANPISALNTGIFSTRIMDLIEDATRNRSFDASLSHLGTDALPIIIKRVKAMAAMTASFLTILMGLFFAYQVAVQQSGVTEATSKFMQSQTK
jgi:type II secretory pathway component PulF